MLMCPQATAMQQGVTWMWWVRARGRCKGGCGYQHSLAWESLLEKGKVHTFVKQTESLQPPRQRADPLKRQKNTAADCSGMVSRTTGLEHKFAMYL